MRPLYLTPSKTSQSSGQVIAPRASSCTYYHLAQLLILYLWHQSSSLSLHDINPPHESDDINRSTMITMLIPIRQQAIVRLGRSAMRLLKYQAPYIGKSSAQSVGTTIPADDFPMHNGLAGVQLGGIAEKANLSRGVFNIRHHHDGISNRSVTIHSVTYGQLLKTTVLYLHW